MAIHSDGSVVPCCLWYEDTRAGNLGRQPFDEVWNGDFYQNLRWRLQTGNLEKTCAQCPERRPLDVSDRRPRHLQV